MAYSPLRELLIRTRPDLPIEEVDRAFVFAEKAHEGQARYSGEPYIVHPLGVAELVLALHPDLVTVQAALLHDVVEDAGVSVEALEKEFGHELADLVGAFSKLSVVKVRQEDQEAEQWKKLFLAMAKDVRIVFIKLAERLHNMRTLEFVPAAKQERIARETLLVHAAIASRLGIYQFKSELEDLCFRFLYPEEFQRLSTRVADLQGRSEAFMAYATSQLEQMLVREGVKVDLVQGRFKHLWSLFQKLEKKEEADLSSVYDLFAVRVILPDASEGDEEQIGHLYSTLGLVHSHFLPVPDRFKDYVAVPKPNGYRSLHTTVLGLGGDLYDEPTEVQIRTMGMHREAELGVASHWSYKMGVRRKAVDLKIQSRAKEALGRVRALIKEEPDLEGVVKQWLEHYQYCEPTDRMKVEADLLARGISEDDLDFIRKARSQGVLTLQPHLEEQLAWLRGLAESTGSSELNLYPDQIFVLTPARKVLELPRGATSIDFAYAVHSEVGHKMTNAKVNGRIAPLDHELHNGDMVEIITRSNGKPNRYWLSIARTASAKTKIRNWFHKQDKETNVALGRELLNKELLALGKSPLDDKLTLFKDYAGKERSLTEREQLVENVGLGTVNPLHMVKMLFPELLEKIPEKKKEKETLVPLSPDWTEKVRVTGEDDLPTVSAACCKPKPPHPIIGYVTRGQSIRIHRLSCAELQGLDGQRFVSAHWKERG